MEEFAGEIRIAADSWRRIGILTFTGDVKRNPKLTYKRIQTHLEKKYEVQFGCGTIVQLVVSRSKGVFWCRQNCLRTCLQCLHQLN